MFNARCICGLQAWQQRWRDGPEATQLHEWVGGHSAAVTHAADAAAIAKLPDAQPSARARGANRRRRHRQRQARPDPIDALPVNGASFDGICLPFQLTQLR
jgi:hypothetical protein